MTNGRKGGSEQLSPAGTEEIADRLHSTAIHLLRRLRTEDDATGLTAPRLSALSVIVFGGPITLGDLAEAEQVRPPTISRLVRDLEEDGLIRVRPDPSDGRVRLAEATARGRRLLRDGRARRVARLAADLDGLDEEDRATLARAAEILAALLLPDRRPGAAPS
ncbi:MAG: MarR family transcriptional regulator [Gemmatimonadota bacterium]|jgi:DNA-binding MarR family transcriptional regulator